LNLVAMPAKNIVKTYYEGGYYHVYNRGVEKRSIFLDDQDCHVFLRYIKLYLSPKETIEDLSKKETGVKRFTNLNLENEVDLLCFALMPNHFHLLLKNKSIKGVKTFNIKGWALYFRMSIKHPMLVTTLICFISHDIYTTIRLSYIHKA